MDIIRTVPTEDATLYEPDPLYARFRTLRRLTVEIELAFTDTEEKILEHARTAPVGTFWEADSLYERRASLDDILQLRNVLGVILGHERPNINIFEVSEKESPEDVPGNGALAAPAEHLYEELTHLLTQWGRLPREGA